MLGTVLLTEVEATLDVTLPVNEKGGTDDTLPVTETAAECPVLNENAAAIGAEVLDLAGAPNISPELAAGLELSLAALFNAGSLEPRLPNDAAAEFVALAPKIAFTAGADIDCPGAV